MFENILVIATVWRRSYLVAICLMLVPQLALAKEAHADLVIHANGFVHERGQAVASLFRDGDDVFGRPYVRAVTSIHLGKATLIVPNLIPGSYALIVFHDENGNDDLDHNFLRLPAEPLGFSNGFKLSAFSGMPSFEKLRFSFTVDSKPLEISVK